MIEKQSFIKTIKEKKWRPLKIRLKRLHFVAFFWSLVPITIFLFTTLLVCLKFPLNAVQAVSSALKGHCSHGVSFHSPPPTEAHKSKPTPTCKMPEKFTFSASSSIVTEVLPAPRAFRGRCPTKVKQQLNKHWRETLFWMHAAWQHLKISEVLLGIHCCETCASCAC